MDQAGGAAVVERGPMDGNGTAPPGRTVRRRTRLPAGRAVVGGFLVALAATGVFAAYTDATTQPEEHFVVARRPLAPGTRLSRADLTLAPMRLHNAIGFRDAAPLLGATTLGPVGRGELLQPTAVLASRSRAPERELSLPIDSSRAVSGDLRAGDRVDVAATFGSGESAYTVFVVRGALVLDRRQAGGGLQRNTGEVLVLSLADPTDALAVAHAVSVGQLTVVRATGTQPAGVDPYRAPAAPTADEPT